MFASILLSLCLSARADIAPSDIDGCSQKVAGDSCQTDQGEKGGCVKKTCSKLDYSNGTPPTSVDYDCLICDPAAAPSKGCSSTGQSAGLLGLLLALPLLRRRKG